MEQTQFNSRLQPCSIRLGATAVSQGASCPTDLSGQQGGLLYIVYGYGTGMNNGNPQFQQFAVSDDTQSLSWNQTYGYDNLNRLTTTSETLLTASPALPGGVTANNWNLTNHYDARGNRWETASWELGLGTPTAGNQFSTATNRLILQHDGTTAMPDDAYDAAGNLTNHPAFGRMSYDAENRLVQYTNDGNIAEYRYDGNGHRIAKTVTGVDPSTTVYVYDASGELAAEFSSGALTDSGTTYLTADALGSTRVVSDASQKPVHRFDYFPYGEDLSGFGNRDLVASYQSSGVPSLRFTGKERDGETGLDYFGARYYSGAQGRFTSPDSPLVDQHPEDPQSWNLYSYGRNNPLRFVDPTGEAATVTSTCSTTDGKTTCDVQIQATAAFYSADSDTKNSTVQYMANKTKADVEKAWSGTYVENDITYNVKTSVDVQVYGSEKEAVGSGAQNVIGVQYGPVGEADSKGVAVAQVEARPLGYSGPDRALFSWGTDASSRAHEFGHMMGVGHHTGNFLMSPNPTLVNATQGDFGWALGPSLRNQMANEHVNPTLRGKPAVYDLQARPRWWFGR